MLPTNTHNWWRTRYGWKAGKYGKSYLNKDGRNNMSDFLTAVSTTTVKRSKPVVEEPLLEKALPTSKVQEFDEPLDLNSAEKIAKTLKNQPDISTVLEILKHLAAASKKADGFNLVTPSPIAAQIVDTLVISTIPDYWRADRGNVTLEIVKLRSQLTACLRTPNGLGAILSRLRPLIADCRHKKAVEKTRDPSVHIEDLLDVLEKVLRWRGLSHSVWKGIKRHAQNDTQRKLMWREYVTQIASGKLLSAVAEAEAVLKERGSERKPCWLGNGEEYASWLGGNISECLLGGMDAGAESRAAVSELLSKALGLGYAGE